MNGVNTVTISAYFVLGLIFAIIGTSQAALVTISDDGMDTTVTLSGAFNTTGLVKQTDPTAGSAFAAFDSTLFNVEDILVLRTTVDVYSGLLVTSFSG